MISTTDFPIEQVIETSTNSATKQVTNEDGSMGFVNEYIPQEDIEKYGIRKIDEYYFNVTVHPDWTIDRQRNTYLRHVSYGREPFEREHGFTFFWNGQLIPIRLHVTGGGVRGGEGWSHYKLLQLNMPPGMEDKQDELVDDLKEALRVYSGGGVYSTRTTSKTTFDF